MSKIFAITQVRYSSSRLPGKVLKKFGNTTFLDVFLKRLKRIKGIDGVICAVAKEDHIDDILNIAKKNQCKIYIGSKENVLYRMLNAGKKYNADILLRVTSDCPLIDPEICNKVINKLIKNNYDYVSNNLSPSFPHGLDCEAFYLSSLEKSKIEFKKTKNKMIKEHVTYFLKRNSNFKKYNLKSSILLNRYERWTLDNALDLKFFGEISKYLSQEKLVSIGWQELLELINKNPSLQKINNISHHFWFE